MTGPRRLGGQFGVSKRLLPPLTRHGFRLSGSPWLPAFDGHHVPDGRVIEMPDLNLDRVSLDDFTVRRLSATLHQGAGGHPGTRQSPWWVYLACGAIPGRYDVSPRTVRLQASTVSGRSIHAEVRIVGRHDDGYGTRLILAGMGPLVDKAI